MIILILQHTPTWVWVLLAALIALGVSQAKPRQRRLGSAMATPVVMTALSLLGAATSFVHSGIALAAWLAGAGATLLACIAAHAWRGIAWSPSTQRISVPGSWWPLALMMAIFATKYVVGVTLALHPERAGDAMFAALLGLTYGAFSGVFMSRGYAILRVAQAARSEHDGAHAIDEASATTSPL